MTSEPFLIIDEQPITIKQALRYLQANRKLDGFIGEIARQFAIEREITNHESLQVSPAVIEQSVIDFRLQQNLTDPKQFQEWLARNGLNYEAFHHQVAFSFKLKKLKEDVATTQLEEYFIERKLFLDRVILSRIIVDNQELAEELKNQLEEGAKFEALAKEYSLTDDRMVNGMVGAVSQGSMPDVLRAAIANARVGDVVGPLGMEGRWGLFRIEEFLPASLEDPQLRQNLQEELFERWLGEKIQKLPIQLQVGE